jgi:hypothetical protein
MNDKTVNKTKILFIITAAILLLFLFARGEDKPFPANFRAGFAKEYTVLDTILQKEAEAAKAAPVKPAKDLKLETWTELFHQEEAFGRNLRVRVQVLNEGETTATDIHLKIPLLGNLNSPYQALIKETFSPEPLEINEQNFGCRTAVFKIDSLAPAESRTIVFDYLLSIAPLEANLSLYETEPGLPGGHHPNPAYLLPTKKVESDCPEIRAKAREITSNLADNLEKAESFYWFVIEHMKYDLDSPLRNCGALAALHGGAGVCEDYATLFVALCRAEGIPARPVYGYLDPRGHGENEEIAPGKVQTLTGCRHCWAEFYLEGLGWVPADPTLNIYNPDLRYFASLPQADHLAQNYLDQPLRMHFKGGELDVTWEVGLAGL